MARFFLIFLFLFSGNSIANLKDLIITEKGDIFTYFEIEMYEDKSASQSFAEIKSSEQFLIHSNRISTGYSKSIFWFRFTLINKSTEDLVYFVEFTENFAHKVHGFIAKNSQTNFTEDKQGVAYLALENSDELLKPKFQINIKSGESKTVYLNIFGLYANFTSFNIIDMPTINKYQLKHTGFYSVYFGAILAILIYNLAIFAFVRESAYLYYAVYVSSFLIWQLGANGLFPFDRFSSSFSYYLNGLSVPIGLCFLMLFARTILETKKRLPKIDCIIKYIASAYFLLSLTAIFFTHNSFIVISFITTFSMLFLLYTGYKSYRSGNNSALIFLIAQAAFLSMSTLFSLMTEGYLEYRSITKHGLISAFLVEIFIFSLAIANRIRTHEQEKLKIINQANKDLDKKVKEHTLELEISKKKLEELASRDPLTNLFNRRFLYDMSNELILIAKREKSPVSVLIFDIDNFKAVNDSFGHSTGDEVIIQFAKLLQNTRECDIAARIGGEEFLLILPNTAEAGAIEIANQIRKDTERLIIHRSSKSLSFTVSGGISSVLVDKDNGIELAIHRADQALYQAKQSGKNQVLSFSTY